MDIVFHYPPELLQLLIDTIPRLCRSKADVLLFFKGAGVPDSHLADLRQQLATDRNSLNKFTIARTVLARLNQRGEASLAERRQVLRRVVEFEDFSACWPEDQLKVKGLVAEIRRVVNVKDAFTRITLEREREIAERRARAAAREKTRQDRLKALDNAKGEFIGALTETRPQTRGTRLEAAVNALFNAYGVSVRESFKLIAEKGWRVLEQIDGVIELDGHLYLVEMKWLSEPVGKEDVSHHLVRIYHRSQTRGLFVSATEFTMPALETCKDALQLTVVALTLVEELVRVLETGTDLRAFLRAKIHAAQIDKKPFVRVGVESLPPYT